MRRNLIFFTRGDEASLDERTKLSSISHCGIVVKESMKIRHNYTKEDGCTGYKIHSEDRRFMKLDWRAI